MVFCCAIEQNKNISRCARIRRVEDCRSRVLGLPAVVGNVLAQWQQGGSPAMNRGGLAAFYRGERGGD
jgi:hypothetical protein